MSNEKKFFPIKTAPACQLKWNWSTIRLYNGTTSSCHRGSLENITVEDFSDFHNTPGKLSDRRIMLEGKWPGRGCEYCRDIEAAGGSSDRMFHLDIPNQYPPELDVDLNATKVTPQIVEVYFDNVCNMACLYCWDGFSSKIEQENIKFGRFEKQGVIIDNFAKKVDIDPLTKKYWQWMELNHQQLKRLHILGGEPFYQKQYNQCLSFFDQFPNPNLEVNVVSNFKIEPSKFEKMLVNIDNLVQSKKIKRFDLTASIDCFGPEQEYVRFGLDLNQWRENFAIAASHRDIVLNINQTLSVLTIKTVPELIKFINTFRTEREIGHYFSTTVATHKFLHPEIFGSGFYTADFDAILAEMPDNTWQQKHARSYMDGLKKQIDASKRDDDKIKQLGVFLDEIDRRRKLNWRKVFPWLRQEIENVV